MADIRNTKAFKALATQTEAELLTRGLDVVSVAVTNVLAHNVEMVADQLGIQPRSALRYIEPTAVADQIAKASAVDTDGAPPSTAYGRSASMTGRSTCRAGSAPAHSWPWPRPSNTPRATAIPAPCSTQRT
ncbi:hypothetical protein GCM10011428_55900 [Streptomyces violaceus]